MLRGNILLVSNNSFLRRGLADSLATDTLSVAGEESSLEAALALIRTGRPHVDVALIDLDSCNDAAALHEIALQQPQVSIVVITADPSQMAHTLAAEVRAKALLPNTVSAEALNLTLQLVILGEDLFLTTGTASEGTKPAARAPLQSGSAPQLSPREAEVLQFIKKGASNKLIARNLDVAEATVKVHVKSMLRKIDVENRTQAAVWALNHGDGANVPSAEDRAHAPRRVLLR